MKKTINNNSNKNQNTTKSISTKLSKSNSKNKVIEVGNKLDLIEQRSVEKSQAINYCRENGGYKYIEASAKDGTNVLKIFEELTFDLANKHQKEKEKEVNNKYKMKTLMEDTNKSITKDKKKNGCC